jgi:hypothetical protein
MSQNATCSLFFFINISKFDNKKMPTLNSSSYLI